MFTTDKQPLYGHFPRLRQTGGGLPKAFLESWKPLEIAITAMLQARCPFMMSNQQCPVMKATNQHIVEERQNTWQVRRATETSFEMSFSSTLGLA